MKYYFSILFLLASLALSSGLRAQYRWHVVLPDQVDTVFHRGITSISCSGESCIATEVIYATLDHQYLLLGDSNVILYSHDGGLSWSAAAGPIPQWKYNKDTNTVGGYNKQGLFYNVAQQIDSLNAIVADQNAGVILITHDGWKTWRADSSETNEIRGIFFANAAEGLLQEEQFGMLGAYRSTVDSGKHWEHERFNPSTSFGFACHSYGDSMFRIFQSPSMIFTTHNNWNSWDTTYISYNGPLVDTSLHPYGFLFSSGDTLVIEGWRWDANSRALLRGSLAMALSSDFGLHWVELPVPRNNGIWFHAAPDQLSLDWKHMVMAGSDSVGRILQSFDGGSNWECDTVPLSNGISYCLIDPFAVTGSGRVLAGIVDDSNYFGSSSLAYLEQVPSDVSTTAPVQSDFAVFPNPATREIRFTSSARNISITDPLGRSYKVAQTANTLDISALPPGVYFVSDGRSRAKFVKE